MDGHAMAKRLKPAMAGSILLMLCTPLLAALAAPLRAVNAWYPLGSGLNGRVYAITVDGANTYAGGGFTNAGGDTNADRIARWDGSSWHALGTGTSAGEVKSILVSGTDVYAGGAFLNMGGAAAADYFARWDGANWNAVGPVTLVNSVEAVVQLGGDIYIAGAAFNASSIDYLAHWDGANWTAVGGGLNGAVYGLAVSGTDLYAVGDFTDAGGNANADGVARWDGAVWNALGTGLTIGGGLRPVAIAVSGANVYVGGQFNTAGGVAVSNVALWNGSAWNAMGAGTNGYVRDIVVDGSDVYVGGWFSAAGGVANTTYLARWAGSSWHAVGDGLNNDVEALTNGSLYVGGNFTNAGGVASADRIARLGATLPATGFPPGLITARSSPVQRYSAFADLTLEIPKIGVDSPIVGVPKANGGWNVEWLGRQIGWLHGTAFPTWAGNTALTAHVYGSDGRPGPFVDLGTLRWGDQIVIHAWGQRHIYEVRHNYLVLPGNVYPLHHEEYDWVTLITCFRFDERLGDYHFRRVVRGVLIEITP